MILVTVGTQLPFDRLVASVDRWAATHPGADVLAQIGETGREPEHIDWRRQLPADRFRRLFESADAIVAHAGIGTILGALELEKPLLIVPRRAALNEHRNDHQLATARRFEAMDCGINIAWTDDDVAEWLESMDRWQCLRELRDGQANQLVQRVHEFLAAG